LHLEGDRLILTDSGGEFLLKPVPSSPFLHVKDVPANEHLCMQLARQVYGIETPPNAFVLLADEEPAYLVRRYDRSAPTSDGKLHQEDLAQVMGRTTESPNWKYEGSYEEMAQAIRLSCPAVLVNLERLWQRIVFCFAVSNGDAHWKNFSVLEDPATRGYQLTPAYDLVATSIHFPNESPLALDLFQDGELSKSFEARGHWTGADFLELAKRWDIPRDRSRRWLNTRLQRQSAAHALTVRSFLSEEIRSSFWTRYQDRTKALEIGTAL
jgi:serine/threonine-protein kinase HipA